MPSPRAGFTSATVVLAALALAALALAAPSMAVTGAPHAALVGRDAGVWASVTTGRSSYGHAGTTDGSHTCATRTDATLWCWGRNVEGQLGLGDHRNRFAPSQVDAGADWASVVAGYDGTCAIRRDHSLWCWGDGRADVPEQLGAGADWSSVSLGLDFACGVRLDRSLWCWGGNHEGQLGLGDTTPRSTPARVGGAADWSSVAAGSAHVCGLRAGGSLWCWGANLDGQLGLGDDESRAIPTRVGAGSDWTQLGVGTSFTCGVRRDHALWCWGNNDTGDLGLGDLTSRDEPAHVGSHDVWRQVSGGQGHSCGVRTTGSLWCWGDNAGGDLGVGDGDHRTVPAHVGSGSSWTRAGAGGLHSCALTQDRSLWCWGDPQSGELGVGNRTDRHTVPTQVGLPNRTIPLSVELASVSADGPADVWAVGHTERRAVRRTFVERWDGSSWTRLSSPNPGTKSSGLAGVDVLSPTDVWAVGSFERKRHELTLVEHWDGTRWAQVASPSPRGESRLTAVTAISASDIWAVGERTLHGRTTLIEHYDGKRWSVVADPNRAWAERGLAAVTAVSPTNIWSVGSGFVDEEAGSLALAEHSNGSRWGVVRTQHHAPFFDHHLGGVSAAARHDVWAVGDRQAAAGLEVSLVEHWEGDHWDVVRAPSPGVGSGTHLRGVSARSSSDAWAAGDYDNGQQVEALLLHWNGTAWTRTAAASPGLTVGSHLMSVTARSNNDAWAVGWFDSGSKHVALVEHWDGSAWTRS